MQEEKQSKRQTAINVLKVLGKGLVILAVALVAGDCGMSMNHNRRPVGTRRK